MNERAWQATSWDEARAELKRRRDFALQMGGEAAVARQRARGKQTVHERIDLLADPGSFTEIGTLAVRAALDALNRRQPPTPSSYVCGLGKVDGRPVAIGGEDFTVSGGEAPVYLDRVKGEVGGFVDDLAHEYRIPMLSLLEGVGGGVERAQESGHGIIPNSRVAANPPATFYRAMELMGEVPCLTAVLGPAAGLAAGRAVLSHFSVMNRETACVFMSGPPVVKRALGYDIDKFALGGAQIHAQITGGIDNIAESEADAIDQVKRVLSYLPQNIWEMPPIVDAGDPPDRSTGEVTKVIPENPRRVYEVRKLINIIFDRDSFFEIGRDWGRTVVQGLARIGGYPVGVFASNPMHLSGALDTKGCDKQVRLMEMCDTFHLPIVYLVDCPGFMIGEQAEREGIARAAMRAIQTALYVEVPIVTLHTRKAYGMGPMVATNPNKSHLRLAWPSAQWGDFPAEGGVDAVFKRQIDEAEDPVEFRRQAEALINQYVSPWGTAEGFGVEEMIDPAETRDYLYRFISAGWGSMKRRLGEQPRYRPRI